MPNLESARYRLSAARTLEGSLRDRAERARAEPEELRQAWSQPTTRTLVVAGGRALMDDSGLVMLPTDEAPDGLRLLLGRRDEGAYVFAVQPPQPLQDPRAHGLRSAAARLPGDELGLLMHAVALSTWHETHPRCARCGAETEPVNAGYARRCRQDGSEHYPRTDPAIIVLVLDGGPTGADRCLLGRQASWPPGRFSTLAGFVEPGESVERAVAREVAEEVGIDVVSVGYAGSQPWPFPASLMLAYYAVAKEGSRDDASIRVDDEEIVEARWFDREGLARGLESGELLVPPAVSVARRLIEGWYGAPLHTAGVWR